MNGLIPDVLLRPAVLFWSFGLSLAFFVGSLIAMPILLARLRADYFARPDAGPPGGCGGIRWSASSCSR